MRAIIFAAALAASSLKIKRNMVMNESHLPIAARLLVCELASHHPTARAVILRPAKRAEGSHVLGEGPRVICAADAQSDCVRSFVVFATEDDAASVAVSNEIGARSRQPRCWNGCSALRSRRVV